MGLLHNPKKRKSVLHLLLDALSFLGCATAPYNLNNPNQREDCLIDFRVAWLCIGLA